jgi:chromosome segregation ATPase
MAMTQREAMKWELRETYKELREARKEIKELRGKLELLDELKQIIDEDCNVTLESILEERAVVYTSSL